MKMELEFVEGSFYVVNLLEKNNYQIDIPRSIHRCWNHRVVLKTLSPCVVGRWTFSPG